MLQNHQSENQSSTVHQQHLNAQNQLAAEIGQDTDNAMLAVSDAQRMGKFPLTMAWWGVCSALFYIFLSATLAVAFGSLNTIIAMGLSVVCYGLINRVLSGYAIETGLSVSLFSRVLFGRVGAGLATLIFFATAIYYAVFEGYIIAYAANQVFSGISIKVAAVIVVLYSVPLVFGSVQKWLDKLNGVLLPFFLLGLVIAVVMTVREYGYSNYWLTYQPKTPVPLGWLHAFIAYMGVWVLMMFTFDFARFGKKVDSSYHQNINFGMPFYVMTFFINGLVGIFLVLSAQRAEVSESAVVDELITVLGGFSALFFIWVTQTRINSANYYLATVNMQSFFEKLLGFHLRKRLWAIVVGIVVLILMCSANVFSYILAALTYQGIFVTAWVAVALAHILSKRYQQLFGGHVYYHSNQVPRFNVCGLSAWFAGAGVGLLTHLLPSVFTPYSPVLTFVVAFVLYCLISQKSPASQWVTSTEADAGDIIS